ncbi:imelysin family protein [Ekhidna sp.]|uniref:imelysin family protein n=1 Tax=Ekhidna sp. TaxID=2608089 RepID=UPI003B509492
MRSRYLIRILFFPVILTLVSVTSCGDDEPIEDVSFDRGAMLTSLADGLIIPNFEQLQASVDDLSIAVSNFNETTTQENLITLRASWVEAVTNYQHCSAFGFGPGSLPLGPFATVLGVFPVDETQVESNIEDPNFNLAASFDRDVRGFFAVEYLIYGDGVSDEEIISGFDSNRKAYLKLIVDELQSTFVIITSEWKSTYREEFISSEGTSAGSSISLLYNDFVKDYENLKNFKVELPAGLTAGQSSADPTLVEAYYSGISTDLIEAHFESSKNIWFGLSRDNEDLIGFEEYLNEVVGGPELTSQTKTAITAIEEAIENLPEGELSANVEAQEVLTLRDLLQVNTPNFKSSMSSLLGISITFNSGDGD